MKLFRFYNKSFNQKAFSLLEVLIAIFILTIGITGAVSLITYSISSVAIAKSQVIATNLAQEGIELVRSIRDSNWLEDVAWDNGLGAGDYRIQYDNGSLLSLAGNPVLRVDSNGFYQYDSGTNTFFRRKITISDISANEIKVISEITWSERTRSFSVSAENRLYDWK